LHNWVLPDHWRVWWGYGLYFLLSACAQFFFSGAVVFWPARWILQAGIAGNAALLLLYTTTRTVGIPLFGPAAGQVESVGWFDLLTAATELGLIVVLLRLLRATAAPHRSRPTQKWDLHTHASLDSFASRRVENDRSRGRVSTASIAAAPLQRGRRDRDQSADHAVQK
jgi:hypothetical protein